MKKAKNRGITFTIACAIGYFGASDLYFWEGRERIDSTEYCKFLDFIKKELPKCCGRSRVNKSLVCEDGARIHTSKMTSIHRKNLKLCPLLPDLKTYNDGSVGLGYFWPGNSPDYNSPVENWFGELKRRIGSQQPGTKQQLKRLLIKCHQEMIEEGLPKRFVQGLAQKMRESNEKNGQWTEYRDSYKRFFNN